MDVGLILREHLFGMSIDAPAAGVGPRPLDLVVSGIVSTQDPRDGYAILGEKGKSARLYHTGTKLDGLTSGELYRVFDDRVVLNFGGKLETLYLARLQTLGTVDGAATSVANAADETQASDFETPFHPVAAAENIFGNLDAQEHYVDGKFAGMQLHPAKHFQRLYGLQDGDVVTAVNGVEITDADTLSTALASAGASLTLTVTRDGVDQTVSLPVPN